MEESKALLENELAKVVGGDLVGSNDTYHHGTYQCPLCRATHELVTGKGTTWGYNCIVENTTCCAATGNVLMTYFSLGSQTCTINVYPENNLANPIEVICTFDYIMAQGEKVVPPGW